MGKYTKLRGVLPPFEQPPDFAVKVDAEKRKILGAEPSQAPHANLAKLAREFVVRKKKKERLEEQVTKLNVELEACSQLLVARLEGEEIQTVQLRGGVTVFLADEPYPSVKDRKAVFDWIKKTRQVELLTVHHQTLKGLVGERLAAGEGDVPGVTTYLKTTARCRGLRGEKNEP